MASCPQCGYPRASGPGGDWLADPLRGLILNDRYRLEERLGAGGMATVFRAARFGGLGGHVAIKVLAPRYARTVIAKRFEREAQVISQLTSPHSVRIYDFETVKLDGIAQEVIYIAMELVNGRTLDEILSIEGRVNFFWGIDVLRQIARALEEAHRLGVVHRDLKPTNIMVVQQHGSTHVKVLDFGIAGLKTPDGPPVEQLTHLGVVSGTPEYMSPEQAAGEGNVTPASDVYALGLVAFEMFAGRRPFQGETSIETLVIRLSEPPPKMEDAIDDPSFPPGLCTVVNKMLRKRTSERYEDAHAVLEALASFPTLQTSPGFVPPAELLKRYASTTAMTAHGESPLGPVTRRKLRVGLWVAIGLLLSGGTAAAVYLALPSNGAVPVVATPEVPIATKPQAAVAWVRPDMAPVGAFQGQPDSVVCRVDAPTAPVGLFVPLALDLRCAAADVPFVPTEITGSLWLVRDGQEIPGIAFDPAPPAEVLGLKLPPRPLSDIYALRLRGKDGAGAAFSLDLALDARTGNLTPLP